jgi:hypothetical protein
MEKELRFWYFFCVQQGTHNRIPQMALFCDPWTMLYWIPPGFFLLSSLNFLERLLD